MLHHSLITSDYISIPKYSTKQNIPQNKIAKSQVQSGYSSTPPNKEVQKVLCLSYFDYFMVSFLWSIRVKTVENCHRCLFYNGTEKILSEIDLTFQKVTAHDMQIDSGDQLQMVENGFILEFDQLQILQTTNLDYP